MNPVRMIYVCDPAKAKTCRKSVCRQNPYSAVPVCEWTGNPEWAKTDAAGNPIIDWENTLLLLKQDIVRDVPAWDQVLDGPLVGPVLVTLAHIQRRVLVIKAAGLTVAQLMGQADRLLRQGSQLPRVQGNGIPISQRDRQGRGPPHGNPVHIDIPPLRISI